MITFKNVSISALILLGLVSVNGTESLRAAESLAIVADPGRLGEIEQAARAERNVNWWDDDLTDDAACTESFAALELRQYLARCLGRPESDISLVRPEQMPAYGRVFVIGSGSEGWLAKIAPATAVADFAPHSQEGYRIRDFVEPDRVITLIKGRDRVGALYGVYGYLEKLGVRFYGLGDPGMVWPNTPVVLPHDLDVAESPDYLTRGFWAFENRGNPDFFTWMARNRLNFWTVAPGQDHHLLKKLGLRLTGGFHNVQFSCIDPKAEYPYHHEKFSASSSKPADPYPVSAEYSGDANGDGKLSYFEAHPEWYCLKDGKRSANLAAEFGDNYCTSNADATRELTQRLVQQCIDGQWREADMINFWMLDNGKWCSCDSCRKQGTYTDRLMVVVDATMKAIKEAQREGRLKRRVQVVTLAYHETLPPPTKPLPMGFDFDNCAMTFFPIERCFAHSFADPTCTEINAALLTQYDGWTKGSGRLYTGSIFVGEYYNVSSFKSLPLVFTKVMAADIPWFYQNGARHFHYMHTLTRQWGTWTLNQVLMGRLLWNTRCNVDGILDEYFAGYYPTTGTIMRRFYADLEQASANSKALKHYVGTPEGLVNLRSRMTNPKLPLFPLDHLHYEAHHPVLNDAPDMVEIMEAMSRARQEIDAALLTCGNAIEHGRLEEDEHRFAYGETMFQFFDHLVQTAIHHRQSHEEDARREFGRVRDLAEKLRGMVDVVQNAGAHADAANGFDASQAEKPYEYFFKLYGSPAIAVRTEKGGN